MAQDDVETMRSGEEHDALPENEHALVRYVRKVVADPSSISADDIAELKRHGWGNAEIVEALCMACLSGFTNTLAMAMKFDDDLVPMNFTGYF